jgi:hypothetical protein
VQIPRLLRAGMIRTIYDIVKEPDLKRTRPETNYCSLRGTWFYLELKVNHTHVGTS